MKKEEIFAAARELASFAKDGVCTRAEYDELRGAMKTLDGVSAFGEELERYLISLEGGDPERPFGGYCFKADGVPLFITCTAHGQETVSPVRLAQTVRVRNEIVNFITDAGTNERYYYKNGAYRPCPDERLRQLLTEEIAAYNEELYRGSIVKEAAGYIDCLRPPGPISLLNANENLVVFQNGTLRLDTMTLCPHAREDLSTVQINADWPKEAGPVPEFTKFLRRLTGGDKEKMRLLMQFMGMCLTNVPGWKTKKALFLYGPGNTGKSVLRNFLERLLGEGNYTNMDLQTLEEDKFAAAQLLGKRLAGSSDMGYLKVRQLAIFKQLTGGDHIFAQQKGKQPFSFRYNGFLWFCMNEPPAFGGDRGDWVYDRMILFPCGETVPEAERDPALPEKLWAERGGIVRRLLTAAKSVIENGYRFCMPDCLETDKTAYRRNNDPVEKFFMECCRIRATPEISPLDECTCKNVFEVFRLWCRDNAPGYVPKKSEFRKTVAALLCIPEEELVLKTMKTYYYTFTLSDAAKDEYGGELFIKRSIA